jgi:tRNA-specific 2-thiouridylase
VGEHRGVAHYTVGQRKGLGVSLGEPVFVTSLDPADNVVNIGRREDLAVAEVLIEETSFVPPEVSGDMMVLVQHRAHGEACLGNLSRTHPGRCSISFPEPVDSVAPGQSAAFYSPSDPEELIGGGIIASTVASQPAMSAVH